jgi:hypothetical protein
MANTVFTAPGPFDRITAIQLVGVSRFAFHIVRDDGVVVIPSLAENLTITLSSPGGQLLFSGQSRDFSTDNSLDYSEEVAGLVDSFRFLSGYYVVELDQLLLETYYAMSSEGVRCYLKTAGTKSLETDYDRAYHPGATPVLIAPGSYEVTIPYWYLTSQDLHPTITKTERITTLYSSIPFRAALEIRDGQSLANFTLPILGIIWTPTADLSGWHGIFDIRDVCTGGTLTGPWQYPANVNQPESKPTSLLERRYILYAEVTLMLSLSSCPGAWNAMSASLSSDFGFSCQLPYIPAGEELVDIDHPISDFAKNINGTAFSLTGEIFWNPDSFTYSTGEAPIYTNQTARLVESPAMVFDSLLFQPLPE